LRRKPSGTFLEKAFTVITPMIIGVITVKTFSREVPEGYSLP
jgi:hypothetical protein